MDVEKPLALLRKKRERIRDELREYEAYGIGKPGSWAALAYAKHKAELAQYDEAIHRLETPSQGRSEP